GVGRRAPVRRRGHPDRRREARFRPPALAPATFPLPRQPAGDGHLRPRRQLDPGRADAYRPAPDLLTVRATIQAALVEAVRGLGVDGEIPDLELGRAKVPGHGDYASSAGLKLARVLRQSPGQIAQRIAESVEVPDGAA